MSPQAGSALRMKPNILLATQGGTAFRHVVIMKPDLSVTATVIRIIASCFWYICSNLGTPRPGHRILRQVHLQMTATRLVLLSALTTVPAKMKLVTSQSFRVSWRISTYLNVCTCPCRSQKNGFMYANAGLAKLFEFA